jgi:hypothetical protein
VDDRASVGFSEKTLGVVNADRPEAIDVLTIWWVPAKSGPEADLKKQ